MPSQAPFMILDRSGIDAEETFTLSLINVFNTIIERFITTSDDLEVVSEKRKGLLYHLLLAALTFQKWK